MIDWDGEVHVHVHDSDEILEYNPEDDTITTVGHMTEARGGHAVSVVQAEDYLQWCQ